MEIFFLMKKLDQIIIILIAMTVMTGGFAVLAGVIPFFPVEGEGGKPIDVKLIRILSGVHAALFIAAMIASGFISKKVYAQGSKSRDKAGPFIVKFALLEAAAITGCVVVLIAGMGKILPDYKQFYFNYASYGYFAAEVYRTVTKVIAIKRAQAQNTGEVS